MAEAQRRRVLDTGIGTNVLSTLSGGVLEQIQKRQAAEQELKVALAKVLAEEQAKNLYDPERMAKIEARSAIESLAPQMARQKIGATKAEMEQPAFKQQIAPFEQQSRLDLLRQYGLLPRAEKSLAQQQAELQLIQDSLTPPGGSTQGDASQPFVATPSADIPGKSVPVLNRLEQGGRAVLRGIGARETQVGITKSLKARATPTLKALGEVGVMTDQDVDRMLGGGFYSDDDTVEQREAKYNGNNATFDEKERVLIDVVNERITPELASIQLNKGSTTVRYALPKDRVAAKTKAREDLIKLRQARAMMNQVYEEANRKMPAIGASNTGTGGGQFQEGQTATNPQTGQTVTYRNGRWQ